MGYCDYSCTLCGQVCPTGAIPRLSLAEKQTVVLGTATIDRSRCIPYSEGTDCLVCEEHCPVAEAAGGASGALHRLRPLRIRLPGRRRRGHPGEAVS